MNGPVVTAARKALASGNVNLVLIWVQRQDESEIRTAFEKTLQVRKPGQLEFIETDTSRSFPSWEGL
jgi:hypothetical protein